MTFDDRLRRELQKAIPADPPADPGGLADELIRRASSGGGGPGGGGRQIALWIGGAAILGGLIGGALGLTGFFDSEQTDPTVVTVVSTTTAPTTTTTADVATSVTTTVATTAAPASTAATTPATEAPATTTATTAPDTTSPVVGQLSIGADPIWELDTEGIPCGAKPRQATIAAQASDDRGIASVTLSWTFPGGPNGSKAMSGSGTYSATFGPFPYLTVTDNSSEVATLAVTATDAAGNSAAAAGSITVFSTSTCFG